MPLSRMELVVGVGMAALLGAGLAHMAAPRRPPMRRLAIEGIHIPSEPIKRGETLTRERTWQPAVDVYVVGWNYRVSVAAGPELLLMHGETILFFGPSAGAAAGNPAFYGEGAGYKVLAGESVKLRLRITNEGADGETQGAQALVYFVAADAN